MIGRPGRSSRRAAAIAALAILPAGVVFPLASGAGAADGYGGQFLGTASANGLRLTMDVVNSATRNPVDGGGPTAQAVLDSVQNSVAYASHPFPGEIPLSGPGAASGAITGAFPQLGQLPTTPPYPFYVEARHPFIPHDEATGPGQSLAASSDGHSSDARAASGFESPAASGAFLRSASSVVAEPDKVVATAESRIVGFSAGPLTLGETVSTAIMTLNADGNLVRQSSVAVKGLAVNGVPVTLTEQGLAASDSTVPLPSTDPLNQTLAQAKVRITIAPKEETESGVRAPAVKVIQELPNQAGTATYLLGSAFVALSGAAASGHPLDGTAGGCVGACPDAGAAAADPVADTSISAPAEPAASPALTDLPPVTSPGEGFGNHDRSGDSAAEVSAAPSDGTGSTGSVAAPGAPPVAAAQLARAGGQVFFDSSGLYGLLVALIGTGLLVGLVGGRLNVRYAQASDKEG